MDTAADRHPLTVLLARNCWTHETFLRKVADQHQRRRFGGLAARKEKVSRWISGIAVPQITTQLAMADVFGIGEAEVHSRGWPDWLLAALHDDRTVLESPWTPMGSVTVLDEVGGPVDRRGFLIASTSTLAAVVAQWASAPQAGAISLRGRRIGLDVADQLDARLDALRHLDDQIGSVQVYDTATAEIRLIKRLIEETSHSDEVARRLYSAAGEATRLAGWCAYDDGHPPAAERHFIAALRASASAGDMTLGASTLAFWANVRYANGDARGALGLLDGALSTQSKIRSGRVVAMLHARQARAHSIAGESVAAYRAYDAALAAYDHAGPLEEDLPAMYWVTAGELHQVAASAALTLGDPRRALSYFDQAMHDADPYDTDKEVRGTAIYLARRAEAYLALSELDAAVEVAQAVVDLMGGVESARGASAFHDLRDGLLGRGDVPVVRDFLDLTA